ncbi:MAG: beta-L-arabinofuranosidase domain-containing protein [Chthonomonadales bacterium]
MIAGLIMFGALFAIAPATSAASSPSDTTVRVVDRAPAEGSNAFYPGNRPPLLPSRLIKLPPGAVSPAGWLRTQLVLQSKGFSGQLEAISPWCQFSKSAWANPAGQGENGWEELPYWLKGYVDLGYVLHDTQIIQNAGRWIERIIASAQPDGWFGPRSNLAGPDLWPNMLALSALRSYYEATGDKRVLTLMTRYFRWQMRLPLWKFLPGSWQKIRGGDNLDSIYWLYNRTGDAWLLDLARVNHERTADWVSGVASWHGVNFAQCFREPAQYFQQTHDTRYLDATVRDYDLMTGVYGQVPGGLYGADENARPGYTDPRQGTETCAMVEIMYSHELLQAITGDAVWGDRCEEVAFNDLPASMTPDLKGLHYLTAPNQIQLDRANKAPMIENGGDMFSYNPRDYRCCQHNVAFGWPYFTEHLWMATPGNGLAAALYAPCSVTARVGKGATLHIVEDTAYPFDTHITFHIGLDRPSAFPLTLRIPGWCGHPILRINGVEGRLPASARGWIVVSRTWRNGDTVDLNLPMHVSIRTWKANKDAVSVYYGPLAFSLKIGEEWRRYGDEPWPGYEVFPTTPWNYGLALAPTDAAASFKMERTGKVPDQPFTPDAAPIRLRVPARRIPEWKQEANGLIGKLQQSPVYTTQPLETVTLIPMGCARLRVSAFPTVSNGQDALPWGAPPQTVSASHVHDTLDALDDGILPTDSADTSIPRFTWWDHLGTTEWVQYDFPRPRKIGACDVYWFDDEAIGGQCRTPASWRLLYRAGDTWKPVDCTNYPTTKDRQVHIRFTPVETTALRLEVQLKPGFSGGILEWNVSP